MAESLKVLYMCLADERRRASPVVLPWETTSRHDPETG